MFYIKLILLIITTTNCQEINKYFEYINQNVLKFNQLSVQITWEYSVNPGNPDLVYKSAEMQNKNIEWQHKTCDTLAILNKRHLLNSSQSRQTFLLCRGPRFKYNEARLASKLYEDLQTIYTEAEICIPTETNNITNTKEKESAILKYLTAVNKFQNFQNLIMESSKLKSEHYFCLKGEDEFKKLMEFSRNELVLKWIWTVWREAVGPPMRKPYLKFVDIQNRAARRNSYPNLGASWRLDLEIPNLRQVCRNLYNTVKPLYTLLHGVTRHFLRKKYGDIVPERGAIPAHLLGNLWSQNWESITDLIIPNDFDLNRSIKHLNWTVLFMAKRVEDFYQSLGLPAMTDTFWRESKFSRKNELMRCHGTAANMFKDGDYRLLYCSNTTKEDFYVLHHEIGHIQYYMAYEKQPALFRQANTAFHESIGDAIMLGAMTPQHLHRLGLINDTLLYNNGKNNNIGNNDHYLNNKDLIKESKVNDKSFNGENTNDNIHNRTFNDVNTINEKRDNIDSLLENLRNNGFDNEIVNNDLKEMRIENDVKELFGTTDDILMLKQALNKVPQIPFSLVIDEYRWRVFEGSVNEDDLNKEFWKLVYDLQGITPSVNRNEKQFDAGAKFHVPDNTPFIRYFLSSFLQHQLFESLCKAAVFGSKDARKPLPETIPLHRCDIYGSKSAGKLLKDFMSRGHSQHWRDILQQTTGQRDITSSALLTYFRPLYDKLMYLVTKYDIPIGW